MDKEAEAETEVEGTRAQIEFWMDGRTDGWMAEVFRMVLFDRFSTHSVGARSLSFHFSRKTDVVRTNWHSTTLRGRGYLYLFQSIS